MTALLVLHDRGDFRGGAPWRDAFEEAGWDGPVLAPDLPGHAGTPPPIGGDYEMVDPVFTALPLLPASVEDGERPVVVGVGASGYAATLLALGGRASALVLVDGLGGPPWFDARQQIARSVAWLRAVSDDPEAVAPMPAGAALDPRLRHGVPHHGSRRLAERMARAMPVPTVLIESAQGDAADLAPLYSSGATVVTVPDSSPAAVAGMLLTALTVSRVPGRAGGA